MTPHIGACWCGKSVPKSWGDTFGMRDAAWVDEWLRSVGPRAPVRESLLDLQRIRIVLASWSRGGHLKDLPLDLLLLCQAQAACRGARSARLPLCVVSAWAEAGFLLVPAALSRTLEADLRAWASLVEWAPRYGLLGIPADTALLLHTDDRA